MAPVDFFNPNIYKKKMQALMYYDIFRNKLKKKYS